MRIASCNLTKNRKRNIALSVITRYLADHIQIVDKGYNHAPMSLEYAMEIVYSLNTYLYPFLEYGLTRKQEKELYKWIIAEIDYRKSFGIWDI